MRILINYLRQFFCKHEFVYEEYHCTRESEFSKREGLRVNRTCKKCGWYKKYWKF